MSDEPNDSQPPPPAPPPVPSQPPPGRPDVMPAAGAHANPRGYAGIPDTAVRVPQIIGAVFWAIGVSVIGVILLSLFDPSVTDPDLEQPDGIALALQAFAALGFISAAIGMTMIANRGGFRDGLRRLGLLTRARRPLGTIGLALLMYIGVVALIAVFLQPQQDDIAENLGADKDATAAVIVAAGFLIIAGAAIGEELFFRGLLFGGLRQMLPLWPAALISGVLFGLPHLPQGDLAVGLQLALFGAILAWSYERSGSLWVPIGMHALNNTLAFYVLVWG